VYNNLTHKIRNLKHKVLECHPKHLVHYRLALKLIPNDMFVTSCSTVQVFFLEKSNLWFVCKLFHLQKTEVLCIIFPDPCSRL
jgi:hypothetical protein